MKYSRHLLSILVCLCFFTCIKKDAGIDSGRYQQQLPDYYNLFDRTSGWIGGDAAYSISLDSQKTLWLFGDTWFGTIANNVRKNSTITAHNTIAIQNGIDPSSATLEYYFGMGQSSFFKPDDNAGFLWPLHGTMIGSELYIFFVQLESTGLGALGFRFLKSKVIKVSNPFEPPSQWQINQYDIPHATLDSVQIIYGASILLKDGYAYIFGTETNNNNRYLKLAKVSQDSITNFSSWKFYFEGTWQSEHTLAERLTDKIGFEFSVSYQPQKGKFVLITSENGFSPNINMQKADSVWGEWTEPTTVYQCPESSWGNNIFNYAAKAHPELSTDNELLISYVSNSFDINDLLENADLYWPRFIKIK